MTDVLANLTDINIEVQSIPTTEISVTTFGGVPGPVGPPGPQGPPGSGGGGVPAGGTTNQVLTKNSNTSGDAAWKNQLVTSVANRTGSIILAEGDITNLSTDLAAKYSVSNPPPYPVSSVAGRTGAILLNEVDIIGLPTDLAAKAPSNSPTFTGTVTIPTPVNATDAATKAYVDGVAQGLQVKTSVIVATAAALPTNTYNNGTAGVGATLTANADGVLTIDGYAVALNDRILVKNEATTANNGIYTCTTLGTVSVPYVLTRTADFDTPTQIAGAFTFVEGGSINISAGFVVTGPGPYTIGTTAIVWSQFSGAGTFSAGTGINITGSVISQIPYTNATPVPATLGGISAGETFSNVALIDMLTNLLYPYQAPAFSSFVISGQTTPVEVGTTISGTKTFTWGTTNSSNVATNSIGIADQSGNLVTGIANSGSHSVAINSIQLTAQGSYHWTISGTNTDSSGFSRQYPVTWDWMVYAGDSTNTTLTAAQIQALSMPGLYPTGFATYAFAGGGYKYFAYPAAYTAASLFTDTSTGFTVTMADSTDDPSYSNTTNGYSYAIVSVTNAQSQTTNYRVYRSKYILGGSINIQVS